MSVEVSEIKIFVQISTFIFWYYIFVIINKKLQFWTVFYINNVDILLWIYVTYRMIY